MHPAVIFILGALFGAFVLPTIMAMVRPKQAPA